MLKRLLLLVVLAGPLSAHASIMIATDTATDLSGSFSFLSGQVEVVSATAFLGLLPGGLDELFGGRIGGDAYFGSLLIGSPDNPFFIEPVGTPIADLAGSFSNNPANTLVYFLFSDIVNEAGMAGTFSGKFAFSTSPIAPVPLPAAAWLFLTALGGLLGVKKLRAG